MVLEAPAEKGGTAWLVEQMDKNPSAFMALLGKSGAAAVYRVE